MPNPFHLHAKIDRLWRRANSDAPGYRQVSALNAIVRELFAPTPQAQLNYQAYLATDPFEVARHKLRDLYDHAASSPAPTEVAPTQADDAPQEEQPLQEDDDPL